MNLDMKYIKRILVVSACALFMVSCEDVFDTDTASVVFEDENQLNSPNDSLYSVMGILSQVQKLGEKYVLLGELRGDLMATTADADEDMQELAAFCASSDNVYRSFTDYYAVINNCNYAITRMDTTIAPYDEKLMLPEFVQIKVIRAWTYLQLALACGEVYWLEKPVMSFDESLADYPVKNIEAVADALIEDLVPYLDVRPLDYGSVDEGQSSDAFIPIRLMLGDLYLLRNRYEEAARMYAKYIGDKKLTMSQGQASSWTDRNFVAVNRNNAYTYKTEACVSFLYSSNPNAYHPRLVRWTYNDVPFLVPAESFVTDMSNKIHLFGPGFGTPTPVTMLQGDLRGEARRMTGEFVNSGAYGTVMLGKNEGNYIHKFYLSSSSMSGYDPENKNVFPNSLHTLTSLPIYRAPHVYLRLAEALNRMGRPSLAFAILKYGLRKSIVEDPACGVSAEDVAMLSSFGADFTLDGSDGGTSFNDNTGTLTRGLGFGILKDTEFYVIPDYDRKVPAEEEGEEDQRSTDPADIAAARADSILYVEDLIVDELAAETCFEGNRFFDLYRVAGHRGEFPAYVADKVAARFGEEKESMKGRLNNRNIWFLK